MVISDASPLMSAEVVLNQILNSYVDITAPSSQRRKELLETYMFECQCSACSFTAADPRTSFSCPQCRTLTPFPEEPTRSSSQPTVSSVSFSITNEEKPSGSELACSRCHQVLVRSVSDFLDHINVAREALAKATRLQFTGAT